MNYETKKPNFISSFIKFSLFTLLITTLTYINYGKIKNVITRYRYSNVKSEFGYVSKDTALDLRIIHEKNSNGNLETYLLTEEDKLPILSKENGLIVGSVDYNWNNFTNQERLDLTVNNWDNLDETYKNQLIRKEVGIRIKNKYHELKDFLMELFNMFGEGNGIN